MGDSSKSGSGSNLKRRAGHVLDATTVQQASSYHNIFSRISALKKKKEGKEVTSRGEDDSKPRLVTKEGKVVKGVELSSFRIPNEQRETYEVAIQSVLQPQQNQNANNNNNNNTSSSDGNSVETKPSQVHKPPLFSQNTNTSEILRTYSEPNDNISRGPSESIFDVSVRGASMEALPQDQAAYTPEENDVVANVFLSELLESDEEETAEEIQKKLEVEMEKQREKERQEQLALTEKKRISKKPNKRDTKKSKEQSEKDPNKKQSSKKKSVKSRKAEVTEEAVNEAVVVDYVKARDPKRLEEVLSELKKPGNDPVQVMEKVVNALETQETTKRSREVAKKLNFQDGGFVLRLVRTDKGDNGWIQQSKPKGQQVAKSDPMLEMLVSRKSVSMLRLQYDKPGSSKAL